MLPNIVNDSMMANFTTNLEMMFSSNDSVFSDDIKEMLKDIAKKNLQDNEHQVSPLRLPEYTFENRFCIILYSILFVISGIGNTSVYLLLSQRRHRKGRINIYVRHLCLTGMLVSYVTIPTEIAWNYYVRWLAGDVMCRVLMLFRILGLYASSCVLIIISLDRYSLIVMHTTSKWRTRGRAERMLKIAWILSFLLSLPQAVLFHEEGHPDDPDYRQCVLFNVLPGPQWEVAYHVISVLFMCGIPLVSIVFCYVSILCRLGMGTKPPQIHTNAQVQVHRYPGSVNQIEKAKERTLKISIVIVSAFVICWTPYFIISNWSWIHKSSFDKLSPLLKRSLFIFAVSNACINPFIYGFFNKSLSQVTQRFVCVKRARNNNFKMRSMYTKRIAERSDPRRYLAVNTRLTCGV